MTLAELHEEMHAELELMELTVKELKSLRKDVADNEPTNREKTAAAGYLAQFYNGVENILKRIAHYYKVSLPKTEMWHIDLFNYFCAPAQNPLPTLFDESLASDLTGFRKFRHVVHHGYGFSLDWSRMVEGIDKIENVFFRFKTRALKLDEDESE